MRTIALIEKGEDNTFTIYTPDLECTIVGEGDTVEEAKADFANSVEEMISSYDGGELPDELKDLTFEYKYDIAALFNCFDYLNLSKFAKHAGINANLMQQYKSGKTYISRARAKEIEASLHRIGDELKAVSL